jgi:hypothetical protein
MFPREIRDSIYEHTFDHEMTRHLYHMRFQAPLPHLRLVSRQFKQEYDEQSPTNTSLFVTDQSQPLGFFYPDAVIAGLVLPRLATRCTVVHITQNLQDQEVEEAEDMMDQLAYYCDPIH